VCVCEREAIKCSLIPDRDLYPLQPDKSSRLKGLSRVTVFQLFSDRDWYRSRSWSTEHLMDRERITGCV
jgi:hypothetical protein